MENSDVFRTMIKRVIATTVMELKGCDGIMPSCLNLLADVFENLVKSIGHQIRGRAELSGCIEPTLQHIMTTFATMGLQYVDISSFAHRPGRTITLMPLKNNPRKQQPLLRVVPYQPHKGNIPKHLPPLPDPHTYIATPAKQKMITEYHKLRERSAMDNHKLSHNLSKYMAKTSKSMNLLGDDSPDRTFLVINPIPSSRSYLYALMPTDQKFDFKLLENNYAATYPNSYASQQAYFEHKFNQNNINNPFLKPCKMPFNNTKYDENDEIISEEGSPNSLN